MFLDVSAVGGRGGSPEQQEEFARSGVCWPGSCGVKGGKEMRGKMREKTQKMRKKSKEQGKNPRNKEKKKNPKTKEKNKK